MKEECTERVTHKRIVFEEKRSKLTVNNPKEVQVTKVKVDGCEVNVGRRCDYLFLANGLEHFVELKGQDINYAYKQLVSTIKKLSENPKYQKKVAFIIYHTGVTSSASMLNERAKFKKHLCSELIIKRSPYTYSL
ncbi:MAG: hypothetical protein LC664_10590 [Flavobacteriales bacterium]|nr:hypothetical protein [Flavobacteriales bacterium]